MTAVSSRFAPRSHQDVLQLVLDHPLAWIVSGAGAGFRATLLPLRPELRDDGSIEALVGHFARSNDHVELLRDSTRALILVLGTQGYISPSWMRDKSQAPTWNYASVQFDTKVSFFEDDAAIEAHLRDLVDTMEAQRPGRWSIEQMGPRYRLLASRVIGFRAQVLETRAKFKLGQDERDDVFSDILAGLQQGGEHELLNLMKAFNPGRAS